MIMSLTFALTLFLEGELSRFPTLNQCLDTKSYLEQTEDYLTWRVNLYDLPQDKADRLECQRLICIWKLIYHAKGCKDCYPEIAWRHLNNLQEAIGPYNYSVGKLPLPSWAGQAPK